MVHSYKRKDGSQAQVYLCEPRFEAPYIRIDYRTAGYKGHTAEAWTTALSFDTANALLEAEGYTRMFHVGDRVETTDGGETGTVKSVQVDPVTKHVFYRIAFDSGVFWTMGASHIRASHE